jgi:hypothetical protein
MIQVPAYAKREDLLTLKSFLQGLPEGQTLITLSISGSIVSTKISIDDILPVQEFVSKLWSNSYH